jgi:serine/threonine protein kinase
MQGLQALGIDLTMPIGDGGQGQVYIGYLRGDLVAVKRIFLSSTDQIDRAKNEARIAVPLRHPFVQHTFGAFIEHGRPFMNLVMKWATGSLEAGKPAVALPILTEALLGLEYLHHSGIYHGDLSLSNLLCTPSGHVTICDFGLSLFKPRAMSSGSAAHAFPGIPANGELRAF